MLTVFAAWGCDTGPMAETCSPEPILPARPKPYATLENVTYAAQPVQSVLDVRGDKMLQVLEDAYRLKPDKRLLHAIAEIHHILTGDAIGEIAAGIRDGRWFIHYRNELVGVLPELPDYSDATDLLTAWTACLAGRYAIPLVAEGDTANVESSGHASTKFFAAGVAAELKQIDERWNASAPDPALLLTASRGLVLLTLQSLDRIEIADRLAAKALATVVLARGLSGADMARDHALLASVMGYASAAERMAADLAPDDVVRLYVTADVDRLRAAAEGEPVDHLAQHLYLLRLARERDVDHWLEWFLAHVAEPQISLSTLKTGLDLNRFWIDDEFPVVVPYLVLLDLWNTTNPRGLPAQLQKSAAQIETSEAVRDVVLQVADHVGTGALDLMGRFEADLVHADSQHHGPFLDAETYGAYLRGHFYSAYYIRCLFYLDRLSSESAAADLVESLQGSPPGVGSELHRWCSDLTGSKSGNSDVEPFVQDLTSLRRLGGSAMVRTYDEIVENLGYADTTSLFATKLLAQRLDSRPSHRYELGNVAFNGLIDLHLTETLYGSVLNVARADYPRLRAWYARFTGDSTRLLALADDTGFDLETRGYAIEQLARLERVSADAVKARFRRLIQDDPDRWAFRRMFARFLERKRDYEEGAAVLEDWLRADRRSTGFDYINARRTLARLYYKLPHYGAAWAAIEPVVTSGQRASLGRAALIAQRLGRVEEAVRLARQAANRYPGSAPARAVLAQVYWEQRRYSDAASALRPTRHRLSTSDWRIDIGSAFVEAFDELQVSDALRAVEALRIAGVSENALENLALAASWDERYEVAFQIESQLTPQDDWDRLQMPLRAYRSLKRSSDQERALEWLRGKIPPSMRNPTSQMIYRGNAEDHDLLWKFIEDPRQGTSADFVWLLRAASAVTQGIETHPHRDDLISFYETAGRAPYMVMGRYLLGLEDEDTMLGLASDPHRRCEVSYYMGVKAAAEGRYREASDWFRIAVETKQQRDGEYVWAHDWLDDWTDEVKSFGAMSTAGVE